MCGAASNFVLSMKDGYRCLTKSAEKQVPEDGEDDTEEMNRFEKWLDEKLGISCSASL